MILLWWWLVCITCNAGDHFRLVRNENVSVSLVDNSTGLYIGFPSINSGVHVFSSDAQPVVEIRADFESLQTYQNEETVGITLDVQFVAAPNEDKNAQFIIRPLGAATVLERMYRNDRLALSVFQLGLYGDPIEMEVSSELFDWPQPRETVRGGGTIRVLGFRIRGDRWPSNMTFEIGFDLEVSPEVIETIPLVYEPSAWNILGNTPHSDIMRFMTFETGWMSQDWFGIGFNARDYLLTMLLMHSLLSDHAIIAVMTSVLERVDHGKLCLKQDVEGLCDYSGEDVTLLLPIVLDTINSDRPWIAKLLIVTYENAVSANVKFIVDQARKFALNPGDYRNLLKVHSQDATWRDSPEGLAGSFYPMDLNAIYMPAALQAIVRLSKTQLLSYVPEELFLFTMRWEVHSQTFFETAIDPNAFENALEHYLKHGIPGQPNLTALLKRPGHPLNPILGVGMTEDGTVVPLMTSDTAMLMLLRSISSSFAIRLADMVSAYFPRGLRTDVGLLASNPAYLWAHPVFNESEFVPKLATESRHGLSAHRWQHTVWEQGLMKRLEAAESHDEILALSDALTFVRDLDSVMCSPIDLHATHWSFIYNSETDHFVKKQSSVATLRPNVLALTTQVNLLNAIVKKDTSKDDDSSVGTLSTGFIWPLILGWSLI